MTSTEKRKQADGNWGNTADDAKGLIPYRHLGSALIILASTVGVFVLISVIYQHDGSIASFGFAAWAAIQSGKGYEFAVSQVPETFNPSTWKAIGAYFALELFFLKALPCKKFEGPMTQTGHVPVYNANGVQAFVATLAVYAAGAYGGVWSPGFVYDLLPELTASMNFFCYVFCTFLYFKGRFFPSTKDCGTTDNFIFDFYAGVELYPRIFGWDVKQWINCRYGMIYWGIAPISYAMRQYQEYGFIADSMLVSVAIQVIYVAKFFWWETGYYKTIDIMHDRAGYMLLWGCGVFLPVVYTITTLYLVKHPVILGNTVAAAIFGIGVFCVYLNYAIDAQREKFREKNGKITVWGKPAKYIEAVYKTDDGKSHKSLLLTSGWWGIARKFNYTLELSAAFSWSVPAMFNDFIPFLYFVFLVILLVDRAFRDHHRCRAKYGASWDRYCEQVRYLIIPPIL